MAATLPAGAAALLAEAFAVYAEVALLHQDYVGHVPVYVYHAFERIVQHLLCKAFPAAGDRPAMDGAELQRGPGGRPVGLRVRLTCGAIHLPGLSAVCGPDSCAAISLGPLQVSVFMRGPGRAGLAAGGQHSVLISHLPLGVSALPAQMQLAIFNSKQGFTATAVRRVEQDGFLVGSELVVTAQLAAGVPLAGSFDIVGADGARKGPGTGQPKYRVQPVALPALPSQAELQHASEAMMAAAGAPG